MIKKYRFIGAPSVRARSLLYQEAYAAQSRRSRHGHSLGGLASLKTLAGEKCHEAVISAKEEREAMEEWFVHDYESFE